MSKYQGKTNISDKTYDFHRTQENWEVPSWMLNKNSALQKSCDENMSNNEERDKLITEKQKSTPNIATDSINRDINSVLSDLYNQNMEEERKDLEHIFNNGVYQRRPSSKKESIPEHKSLYETFYETRKENSNYNPYYGGNIDVSSSHQSFIGKKRKQEGDDLFSVNSNHSELLKKNNYNNFQNLNLPVYDRINFVNPNAQYINENININNISVNTSKSNRVKVNKTNSFGLNKNKVGYDGLLEELSEEEGEVTNVQNINQITNNNVCYMNKAECGYVNNKMGSLLSIRHQFKAEQAKLEEIKKDKNVEVKKEDSFEANNNRPNTNSSFWKGEPSKIMQREMEIEKRVSVQVNKEGQTNILNNLVPKSKTKIFFKLFYNGRELQTELSILNNSIDKSVLKIDYFLDNDEFFKLKLLNQFETSSKLEIFYFNTNDEETNNFFTQLSTEKVALVQELSDFFAIIHSKNKLVTKSLDFGFGVSIPPERDDLLIIIKVTDEKKKDKIKELIRDLFNNKSRTSVASAASNHNSHNNSLNTSFVNNAGLAVNKDEVTVKEDYLKELESLREFKYAHRKVLEDAIKNKENEIKNKFKIYYDKIITDDKENIKNLEKHKEDLAKENKKVGEEHKELKNKYENSESEKENLKKTIASLKERNQDLFTERSKMQDKLKKLKDFEARIIELESLNEELKGGMKTQEEYYEKQIALQIQNKNVSKNNHKSTIKIDEFVIVEEVTHAQDHVEVLQKKVEELTQLSEQFSCILCCHNLRDVVTESCNHLVMCSECAERQIRKYDNNVKRGRKKKNDPEVDDKFIKGNFTCPICKTANSAVRKVLVS